MILVFGFILAHKSIAGEIVGSGNRGTGAGVAASPVSAFDDEISRCGETSQEAYLPSTLSGQTLCGAIVRGAVQCVAESMGITNCNARCGDARDFVDCSSADLVNCGYVKVGPDAPECLVPGSIRAYSSSPTMRGQKYGHVEFVCGVNRFCSSYREVNPGPWPTDRRPSQCWALRSSLGRVLDASGTIDYGGRDGSANYPSGQSNTVPYKPVPIIREVDVDPSTLVQTLMELANNKKKGKGKNPKAATKTPSAGVVLRGSFRPAAPTQPPSPAVNSFTPQTLSPKADQSKSRGSE